MLLILTKSSTSVSQKKNQVYITAEPKHYPQDVQ
jgi:hypothetical protein